MLVLASTSPRRRRILEDAGIPFRLAEPGPEPTGGGTPRERALERAARKAAGARAAPLELVVGVDTVVDVDGVELGKPVDGADAARMIRLLSGREHEVHTAVCVRRGDGSRELTELSTSRVRCRALDAASIDAYVAAGDWADKAGGYAIQGAAADFMQLVAGRLDTVVGLPVDLLERLVATAGGPACDRP